MTNPDDEFDEFAMKYEREAIEMLGIGGVLSIKPTLKSQPDPPEISEQDYKDMDNQHINDIIDSKMLPETVEESPISPSIEEINTGNISILNPNDPYGDAPDPDYELDEFTVKAEIVNCTVKLSKEQGSILKDLITEIYPHTFPHYCTKVGISTPNFYNTVNGERPCSLEFFNKLLSGIGYKATMLSTEILIQETETTEIVEGTYENEPDTIT